MTLRPNANSNHDLIADYLAGDPDAVRAVAPPDPTPPQWAAALSHIHARLARSAKPRPHHQRPAVWFLPATLATTAAAVLLWLALHPPPATRPALTPTASDPETVATPPPLESDPLVEWAVLPIATDDDVVFERVPGTGVFPVGVHPLPDIMRLAAAHEVELDDPDEFWPPVTPSPGDAPMLLAPRLR